MEFTKKDLINGMIVEFRNGEKFFYMEDRFIGKNCYGEINNYDNKLNYYYFKNSQFDIVNIYKVNWCNINKLEDIFNHLTLIWKRKEKYKNYPKLTRYEFNTLQRFKDQEYLWIARSTFGSIMVFSNKPKKVNNYWYNVNTWSSDIFDSDFQFIKEEDKEPWSIKELLENCEVEE